MSYTEIERRFKVNTMKRLCDDVRVFNIRINMGSHNANPISTQYLWIEKPSTQLHDGLG